MKQIKQLLYLALVALVLVACGGKLTNPETVDPIRYNRLAFSSDSAYAYIEKQMSFGPRVPNSEAHKQCRMWLMEKLEEFGAEVEIQTGIMPDYRGSNQFVYNIIAHFSSPEYADRERILLGAHYDTRPWCDEEPVLEDRIYNVPGANDGASGVGVLLEIARQLGIRKADTGITKPVDIIFFDVEDSGAPHFYTGYQQPHDWCLGSQMWAKNFANAPYAKYRFGIVLDMVGAPDAVFTLEGYSYQFAPEYQKQIWKTAEVLGYAGIFKYEQSSLITDDHYYINMYANIPCVDIIHCNRYSSTGFPSWWHTRNDDMQNISKSTLQAVGEVVIRQL